MPIFKRIEGLVNFFFFFVELLCKMCLLLQDVCDVLLVVAVFCGCVEKILSFEKLLEF